MKRREFLAGLAGTTTGVFLSQCSSRSPLPPKVYKSQDGRLDVSLEARQSAIALAGKRVHLMHYNGQIPGPRLEVNPGDWVRIQFTNALAVPSNLHYHGLHIPPTGTGDNAFLHIPPGESFRYEFQIPETHPAGLFWYHPHHHGQVAEQVFGGLAGPILVRSDLDTIPEVQAAQEEVLVLQDFEIGADGRPVPPDPLFQRWGREGRLITVNGQVKPSLSIPTGGLLRLRLLNASPSRFYRLALEDHPLYLIATDGGAIAEPLERPELVLAPGERADVLIKGDRPPGRYPFLTLPYDRGLEAMMPTMAENPGMDHSPPSNPPQVLATITYGDRGPTQSLPDRLIPVEPLPEPDITREWVLDHGIDAATRATFLINGKGFDPTRVNVQTQLNRIEDWKITNAAGMNHPFHLHVHPFQVISRNGQPEPFLAWRDTVSIAGYEEVVIRIAFKDFPGKTVYHCHILDHEDQGMMGIVAVT